MFAGYCKADIDDLRMLRAPFIEAECVRSLSEALSKTSREMSVSPPPKGGLGSLLKQLNDPGTQEGLRMLAILGKHLGESIRK